MPGTVERVKSQANVQKIVAEHLETTIGTRLKKEVRQIPNGVPHVLKTTGNKLKIKRQ